MRIVSLVPSVTETLIAWGTPPIACTRFCEQPAITHVGGTKDPDIAAIVALAPDLVVVDEEENRKPDADALSAAGLAVHVIAVRSVEDVAVQLAALAAALGVEAPRSEPLLSYESRRRRVAVLIWRRPWMTLGRDTYGGSVLERLGFSVVAGGSGRYPQVELGDLQGVERVLLPTEPYAFKQRHVNEVASSVSNAQVSLVDGQDLFWWGSRTPAAIRRLAAALS